MFGYEALVGREVEACPVVVYRVDAGDEVEDRLLQVGRVGRLDQLDAFVGKVSFIPYLRFFDGNVFFIKNVDFAEGADIAGDVVATEAEYVMSSTIGFDVERITGKPSGAD